MCNEIITQMDISIIIVNYNSFNLLKQCLDSIIAYTKDISYEVIIVDNNSTEGNVEKQICNYDKIKLIKNLENRGFGAANNQGLTIANGKYVLFINNDTVLLENSIKAVFEFAEEKNDNLIIGCKLLNQDNSLQYSVYNFPSLLNIITSNLFLYLIFPKSKYFNKYHLMNKRIQKNTEVDVVTGAFLFATRESIKHLGGFDERFFFYNEETDLCYRFKLNGGKIFYYPETSIIHLKGGSANKNLSKRYRNESIATIQYYQKHFKGLSFWLAVFFHYLGLLIRIPIFFVVGLLTGKNILLLRSFYNIRNLITYPTNRFKV